MFIYEYLLQGKKSSSVGIILIKSIVRIQKPLRMIQITFISKRDINLILNRDRRGRDRVVVGFTSTYAISDYRIPLIAMCTLYNIT